MRKFFIVPPYLQHFWRTRPKYIFREYFYLCNFSVTASNQCSCIWRCGHRHDTGDWYPSRNLERKLSINNHPFVAYRCDVMLGYSRARPRVKVYKARKRLAIKANPPLWPRRGADMREASSRLSCARLNLFRVATQRRLSDAARSKSRKNLSNPTGYLELSYKKENKNRLKS